ncbi:copper chaperone PCu(A)C [Cellulomonas sp. NPDC089187]|uniref:copper chaperone PCu(A)C n=1 Tax=Cellulomonas sp. NPDC089187 TaxID=3154970 RepID=UPI003441199D
MSVARIALSLSAAALALTLSACTGTSSGGASPSTGGTAAPTVDGTTSPSVLLTVQDAWVKATDSGMTAAFGVVHNGGTEPVTLLSATSPTASMVELHETVDDGTGAMLMQEKDGGFTIPAGEDLTLEPGGNHLMFMDVTEPVRAGDEVEFTLSFDDGTELTVTAPAKDYSGANENYGAGH